MHIMYIACIILSGIKDKLILIDINNKHNVVDSPMLIHNFASVSRFVSTGHRREQTKEP